MSERPSFSVEYLEPPVPIDAEPLPDEFSAPRLKRALLILGGIVVVIAAAILLAPGLDSLRDRFHGAQPGWLAFAALLEILSCVSYVMVFRGVFCDRMSWPPTRSSRSAAPAGSRSAPGSCAAAGCRVTTSRTARSRSSSSRASPT